MSSSRKILELNAFDMKNPSGLAPETEALVARRQRTFGPTSMLFYKRPLNIVRAEGVWLHDADGSRYLDAYNNVPSIGHCHPAVVAAVSSQLGILNTHTRYLYDLIYTYAERLLGTMPGVPAMSTTSSIRPRNSVSMIDLWTKFSPALISLRACMTARRALVPVPQGERSRRPGDTTTVLRAVFVPSGRASIGPANKVWLIV